jgi:hypothetical protein
MQTEMKAQRYDAAKRLAAEAQALAEKAINDGSAVVVREREEAENAIYLMQGSISKTEQVLNDAIRSKPYGADLQRLEQDFADARTIASQAVEAQNEGRYDEAINKSQAVRATLSSITSSISQSVISISRKK